MEILKLDSALEVFYLNKDKAALSIGDVQKKMPFKLTGEEISMMMNKFRKDSLILPNMESGAKRYFITYEGIKFHQRGGFLHDKVRHLFKKLLKIFVVLLGIFSTIVGIVIGLRELL